jgi:hypothetical protein
LSNRKLYFSLGGNAYAALVSAAFVLVVVFFCVELLTDPPDPGSRQAARLGFLGVTGWVGVMAACGFYFLWFGILSLARFFIDRPAIELYRALVATHATFVMHPRVIAFSQIEDVRFDRGDRIRRHVSGMEQGITSAALALPQSYSGALGARMAQKCRTVLQIIYRNDAGRVRALTLQDNKVDGGTWALARLARDIRRAKGWPGLGRSGER